MTNKELGRFGENMAVEYLKLEGYEIIKQNFTTRLGEIDIVARKGKKIVFFEVKTRTSDEFGLPREAVNKKKVENIRKVAAVYMMWEKVTNYEVCFDVIEVFCNHIENAF